MATSSFYRERADQAQRDADNATLVNVRERHIAARDAWIEMADKAESVIVAREKNEAEKLAQASSLAASSLAASSLAASSHLATSLLPAE